MSDARFDYLAWIEHCAWVQSICDTPSTALADATPLDGPPPPTPTKDDERSAA